MNPHRMRIDAGIECIGAARWTPQELARGVDRYRRYLTLFRLDENSFSGQTVCHLGCGPFGGIVTVLRGLTWAYAVDSDVAGCTRHRVSRVRLLQLSRRTGRCCVPIQACDAVFCLGTTGDTTRWYALELEARRICKIGGHVYLWWRPADDYWKHLTGRLTAKWNKTGGLTVDRMRRIFRERNWIWGQVSSGVDLPNLYPAVEARWTILQRSAD